MRKIKLEELYESFSRKEGSQHIASEYAVKKIQSLVEKFQVQKILEIGLGIGSISGTLLSLNESLQYVGTEDNQFCLASLSTNLKQNFSRLQVFKNINLLPKNQKFDLIIIDGKDEQLNKVKDLMKSNGIIAIEGDRVSQLEVLYEIFPNNKMVHSISMIKNKSYSPFSKESWQGGVKIIFVDPTKQQFLWWLKEKIKTKVKYLYRGCYL